MKNIRNILLLLIAVMVLAACSPETGEQDLTDEDIALLGNVTKESFDAFDVLETGTESLTVGDYTVQAALTVESSTNWHMVISGVSSTDSSDAFSYTITSEDYSDQAKEITVTYKGSHAVTADKLLDSVKLPADPDAVLEDDEIAILNEAAIEGFKGFGYLISGTFEYDATGSTGTATLVATDDSWSMTIAGTTTDGITFSFVVSSDDTDTISVIYADRTFNDIDRSRIMADVIIPEKKTALTEEEIAIVNEALKAGFSGFEYLVSGTFEYTATSSTGTATLVATDDSWSIAIEGTATDEDAFSFTISSDDAGTISVTYAGITFANVDRAEVMADITIPEKKTTLTEEEVAVLNNALKAAFAEFDILESGTKDVTSDGYSVNAVLTVETDGSWTMTITGSEDTGTLFSFTIGSDDVTVTVEYYGLHFEGINAETLMNGVVIPPTVMTEEEKVAIVTALSVFNHADFMTLLDETLKSGTYVATDSSIKVTLTTSYGDVTVVFNGTRNDDIFDASSYSVSSSALTLSEDMTLVLDNVSGEFSSYSQSGGIPLNLTFILSGDNAVALDAEDIPTVKFEVPSSGSIAMSDTTASDISEFDFASAEPQGATVSDISVIMDYTGNFAHVRTFNRLDANFWNRKQEFQVSDVQTSLEDGTITFSITWDEDSKGNPGYEYADNDYYVKGDATLIFSGNVVDRNDGTKMLSAERWVLSSENLDITKKTIFSESGNSIALESLSGRITKGSATSIDWCTLDFLLGDDDKFDKNDRMWGKDKEASLEGNIVWGNDPGVNSGFIFNKDLAPQFGFANEMSGLIKINTSDEVLIVSGEMINNAI